MPSHLTRVVFRRLVANKPLLCSDCLWRPSRPRIALQHGVRLSLPPRRSFFNMFKAQRKMKPAEVPPGLELMSDLGHMQHTGERLPPPAHVAKAMADLFAFFSQRSVQLEDFHLELACNSFEYLLAHPNSDGQPWFSRKELDKIFGRVILSRPATGGKAHLAFGRMLHAELKKLMEENVDTTETEPIGTVGSEKLTRYEMEELPKLVLLLTTFGASLEAKELIRTTFTSPWASLNEAEQSMLMKNWFLVLGGLALEDSQAELLMTVELMKKQSLPFTSTVQCILIEYFAKKNDLEQTKYWYLHPTESDSASSFTDKSLSDALAHLLKACALCGDHAFGHQVVASVLREMPDKKAWDAIFLWSAAIGKGADEIDRMMNVMIRRNNEQRQEDPSVPVVQPDVDTINMLVDFSMSKQDSYSAERYVTLGEKRGISPNERTFRMQIQYRLSIQDFDGARAAYFNLQGDMSGGEESVVVVNQLIQAMCKNQPRNFDDIMAIVDDLHERKARLSPETVADLCVLHLSRENEIIDAVDLLQTHAWNFSPDQRVIIRKKLAAFILDSRTSTTDAYNTYQILRTSFKETPREDRLEIMNNFFARKRSDMACRVFFHMRNETHEVIAATKEVYIAAFTGFARNADAESLEYVHNQLKLDLTVEPDTRLRNSLMLAYAATGDNKRALEFWAEIGASKEGPTYNSIAIAFRSCEGMPFGDKHAKSIWYRLKEMDVEIDKKIFTAYLGALQRNHLHDEALALVEAAEEEYGFKPDLYILGNWFNTVVNIEKQAKVEEWIKERYSDVWAQLEALGYWVTMDGFGYRQYNFNRDLDP